MFCAGRVPDEDLQRTMKACGGSIQSTVHDLNDETLGNQFRSVFKCMYTPNYYILYHILINCMNNFNLKKFITSKLEIEFLNENHIIVDIL